MGCRPENLVKFNEMGWQCLYYSTAWISGVFFYFENGSLARTHWWKDYPNHPLYAEHKLYYLLQLAFWIHMVFVTVRGRVGGTTRVVSQLLTGNALERRPRECAQLRRGTGAPRRSRN